jgi:hypothetical protein
MYTIFLYKMLTGCSTILYLSFALSIFSRFTPSQIAVSSLAVSAVSKFALRRISQNFQNASLEIEWLTCKLCLFSPFILTTNYSFFNTITCHHEVVQSTCRPPFDCSVLWIQFSASQFVYFHPFR